VENKVTIAFQ